MERFSNWFSMQHHSMEKHGGQTGDKGYLEAQNGDIVYIIDTKKKTTKQYI
jgi:Ser-tRNA(Ala) deacylase AlaX